ncbi:MAG: bifunctional riboflavin kinase/FAD synthetase [Mariniblastus sp.]|nr:bifunctional riboflavin kinase/FAD synthetase [Mariniblastus sp.]
MKLIRQIDDFPDSLRGGAITIGNFDGVHRGHAVIVDQLKRFASDLSGPAIVFTFDPHPVRILRPEQTPPPLTWTNRKADLLAELGVDAVFAYPTDLELLQLTYREFFDRIIVQQLGAKAMVEGPNFFFGKGREGNIENLAELCTSSSIQLEIVKPLVETDEFISSSRIRNLIRQGDVDTAREMLTRPYRIRGMVTHGAARGTTIGFPTANLDAIDTLIPAMGVYAGRTYVRGRSHWSAIHIGPNPTFGEELPKVESHLLEFEESIYGEAIEVDFVSRIRDIQQFESVDQLTDQLKLDVDATRDLARQFSS